MVYLHQLLLNACISMINMILKEGQLTFLVQSEVHFYFLFLFSYRLASALLLLPHMGLFLPSFLDSQILFYFMNPSNRRLF